MGSLERPTGYLGILYDRITRYSNNPLGTIKEFANRAKAEGVIDDKMYEVVEGMIRLPAPERINPETLNVPSRRSTLRLEKLAYIRLTRYLPLSFTHEEFNDIDKKWRMWGMACKLNSNPQGWIEIDGVRYYNRHQTAKKLGISDSNVAKRRFSFKRHGHMILIPVAEVEEKIRMLDKILSGYQ